MTYKMTFGAEFEVGDVRRDVPIPADIGTWANTETDVVNIHGEFRGIAADPLGIDPPMGGEVNLLPAKTPAAAAERAEALIDHLHSVPGNRPSYSALNASHVHVRVEGLRDNIDDLKKLQDYIVREQDTIIEGQYMKDYVKPKWTPETRKAHTVPLDGARRMMPWMNENIQEHATDFESFIDMQTRGKDAKVRYRMFRYCVNTYNLKFIDTIEFRWFRMTLDPEIWASMFLFCERFLLEALGDQTPAIEWMDEFIYPGPIEWDHEVMAGWEKTRYTQERFGEHPRRELKEAV